MQQSIYRLDIKRRHYLGTIFPISISINVLISLKNPQHVRMMSAALLLRHPKNMPITAALGLSVDLANRHQYRFHNFNIAVGSMIDVAEFVVAQSQRCKEEWKLLTLVEQVRMS